MKYINQLDLFGVEMEASNFLNAIHQSSSTAWFDMVEVSLACWGVKDSNESETPRQCCCFEEYWTEQNLATKSISSFGILLCVNCVVDLTSNYLVTGGGSLSRWHD